MLDVQSVNMSAVTAPVQANLLHRTQATQKLPKPEKNSMKFNAQRIDINKMTQYLQGITRQTTTRKCARSVRLALQVAGARFQSHPVAAADWGSTLTQIGYRKINLAFDRP